MKPSRHRLEEAADEILLKDGRVYSQGYVKTNRAFTLTTSQSDNRIIRERRRQENREAYARLTDAYRALPKEKRADIRDRYRKYNPNSSPVLMPWSEWLAKELNPDGLSLQ